MGSKTAINSTGTRAIHENLFIGSLFSNGMCFIHTHTHSPKTLVHKILALHIHTFISIDFHFMLLHATHLGLCTIAATAVVAAVDDAAAAAI